MINSDIFNEKYSPPEFQVDSHEENIDFELEEFRKLDPASFRDDDGGDECLV